jgi:U3 small nucleolar RNA-associated protein 25
MACVNSMRTILGPNTTTSNTERFLEDYGLSEEDVGDNEKPSDWKALFHGKNVDDDFKLGIQVNPGHGKGSGPDKGVYLRLYSDFYQSDIIIASPLGIRLLLENKGKAERDFLSSIEMAYLHQADVLYHQNWEHVDFVLRNMNLLPTNDRGTDFSRVRPYFLEGKGANYRQLIISTSFNQPIIQASYREFGKSLSGGVRIKVDPGDGSIVDVISKVKQVFQLVPVQSLKDEDNARYEYFIANIIAPILRLKQGRTLIITPSYLHFIRVRNHLMEMEANAAYVSEYSRDSEISRGRSRFFHGHHDILLYSGRAHFFRRFQIRGAMNVIFYSLPEVPQFYAECVNMLAEASNAGLEDDMSCIALCSKYEQMALERIVGVKRSQHMLSSDRSTFMFK